MKKLIPLLLLFVFAHDVAIDAFESACSDQNSKAACHMCVCQNHATPQVNTDLGEKTPTYSEKVLSLNSPLMSSEFSRFFFHPPKALA